MASGSLTDKVFLKSAWFEIGNVPGTLLFCFAYLFVLNSRRGWSKGDRAFSGQSLAGNWVTCSPPFFPPAHVYLTVCPNTTSENLFWTRQASVLFGRLGEAGASKDLGLLQSAALPCSSALLSSSLLTQSVCNSEGTVNSEFLLFFMM